MIYVCKKARERALKRRFVGGTFRGLEGLEPRANSAPGRFFIG